MGGASEIEAVIGEVEEGVGGGQDEDEEESQETVCDGLGCIPDWWHWGMGGIGGVPSGIQAGIDGIAEDNGKVEKGVGQPRLCYSGLYYYFC